ncbi:MAG: beta-ketoacyl synthase chain length factor [Bacteroidales bacterium]|nr:beta-ketoacyl synthase chain length factor [Bacteroidales bacterium]
MSICIKGTGIVSPQKTFHDGGFPDEVVEYRGIRYLKCIEPPYREYIDPMTGRRMSRIVRMGICAAKKCLQDAHVTMPDAIITGTGLGCIEDTEKFLTSVIRNGERLLNPTPFIQSTHNTISSAIALSIKCHSYNSTYVHRGFSFENALRDGIMFLHENPDSNVLVGGLDEITDHSYLIMSRMGFWKRKPIDNLALLEYGDRGSVPGEGVSFFMLGNRTDDDRNCVRIRASDILYKPQSEEYITLKLQQFLAGQDAGGIKPDLLLFGLNGDPRSDSIYHNIHNILFRDCNLAYYKHLCGEYDTSVTFALWLATMILRHQQVPDVIKLKAFEPGEINNILIYNHVHGINHSFMLITRC